MDQSESSGTGRQVFGIPIGLIALVVPAMVANLIIDNSTSRGPAPARR